MNTYRRAFLHHFLDAATGIAALSFPLPAGSTTANARSFIKPGSSAFDRLKAAPKLFCTAYITPTLPTQGGQERIVARYPLALVPQDHRDAFRGWRDKVRSINPDIILLAYQAALDETAQPGPGNEVVRGAGNIWLEDPPGTYRYVYVGTQRRRIADPRKPAWRSAFLTACHSIMASYPYDGIFFDNCTVYPSAHPSPLVRQQMLDALQSTILEIRSAFPKAILVGNSSYDWKGLNGECNEGRPGNAAKELAPKIGQTPPWCNMLISTLKHNLEVDRVEKEMQLAHSMDAFYCAAVDYQHVLWFDSFSNYLSNFRVSQSVTKGRRSSPP